MGNQLHKNGMNGDAKGESKKTNKGIKNLLKDETPHRNLAKLTTVRRNGRGRSVQLEFEAITFLWSRGSLMCLLQLRFDSANEWSH
eukprot:gene1314-1904_t